MSTPSWHSCDCCSPPPPAPSPPPPPPCTPYLGVCGSSNSGRKLRQFVLPGPGDTISVHLTVYPPCCAGMGCAVQSNSSTICAYPPSAPTVISVTTTGGVFNVTASPSNNTGGPDIGEVTSRGDVRGVAVPPGFKSSWIALHGPCQIRRYSLEGS